MEPATCWEDEPTNRLQIRDLARGIDADALILPELTFSGFTMAPRVDPRAEPFLQALAKERNQAFIAGYVGDGPQNMAVAVDAGGGILARYAKLHPFSYSGEEKHYRAGDALPLFELNGFTAAMLICYDLRFPEAFREATLRGAQLLLVIANWPAARVAHWRALLIARAIENQAFVIGVNRIGSDPQIDYVSSSLAVGPCGDVLHEGAGVVEIDPAEVGRVRSEFPFLKDIRTDRYTF